MNFQKRLISGEFIKRYKRFFVDVKIGNNTVTAHCPNTGSMLGILNKGNKVWLSKSDNPKRKLKYTLQVIEDKKSQWSNIKRQGSVIDETSKHQSHQELLRKLKAQYRSPRSQHGRMLYQYKKGKAPRTNNVNIKYGG